MAGSSEEGQALVRSSRSDVRIFSRSYRGVNMSEGIKTFGVALLASLVFCAAVAAQEPAKTGTPPAQPPVAGRAEVISCPVPEYPRGAQRSEVQGTTVLKILVNSDGVATKSELVQSSGSNLLDKASIAALKGCRFKPATDGSENWRLFTYQWKLGPDELQISRSVLPVLIADSCAKSSTLTIAGEGQTIDTIYLRFLLTREGKVVGARLEHGSGNAALDAEAIKVTESCRYTPRIWDGMPVSWAATIRYKYVKHP